MGNIILSSLILLCFAMNGYWLYTLLGKPGRTLLTSFVLSAWAGLLSILLASTTLYTITQHIPAHFFAFPLLIFFTLASFTAFIFFRKKSTNPRSYRSSLAMLLLSFIAILFISSPLKSKELTYYSTYNAEYFNYALLADVTQFHGYDTGKFQADKPGTQSREISVGLIGSFFATLTGKSNLFIIQPLSNAFAWLVFMSLGAILIELSRRQKRNYWYGSVTLVAYIAALFSSANLHLWTLSFMSQYLSQVILIGLILYLIASQLTSAATVIRKVLALGIALAGSAVAYPEQLIITASVIGIAFLFIPPAFSYRAFGTRLIILLLSLGTALVVGNVFLLSLVTQILPWLRHAAFTPFTHLGMDIYGPTASLSWLLANLFGYSSIYWGQATACPSLFNPETPCILLWNNLATSIPFFSLILLLLLAVIRAIYLLIKTPWQQLQILPLLFLGYLILSISGLWLLYYLQFPTNYMAVKFIITWIWVIYIASVYLFGTLQSTLLRSTVSLLGIIVLVTTLHQGYLYSKGMRSDKIYAFYTESDMKNVSNLTKGQLPLTIAFPDNLRIFNMVGTFIVLNQNIWPQAANIHKNGITDEHEKMIKKDDYQRYHYLLALGPRPSAWHALDNAFGLIYQSNYLALFQKKSTDEARLSLR